MTPLLLQRESKERGWQEKLKTSAQWQGWKEDFDTQTLKLSKDLLSRNRGKQTMLWSRQYLCRRRIRRREMLSWSLAFSCNSCKAELFGMMNWWNKWCDRVPQARFQASGLSETMCFKKHKWIRTKNVVPVWFQRVPFSVAPPVVVIWLSVLGWQVQHG